MSITEKITLYPSNWLYNAGVIGFLRVLEFGGKRDLFQFNRDGSVEINKSALDNFEIYYFQYVSKLYFVQKIIGEFADLLNNLKKENKIKELKDTIKEFENYILKEIINLNSYPEWDRFIEELNRIKYSLYEKIREIKDKLREIVDNKTSLNKIEKNWDDFVNNINTFWNSLAEFKGQADFLGSFYFNKKVVANPKGARLDRPARFKEEYLNSLKTAKLGNNLCIFCGSSYFEENLSELTEGDFSVLGISNEKFANFYNYYTKNGLSYNRKCCLCQVILLCAFAGFNYKPFQLRELDGTDYIFVNYPSFKEMYEVNNKIQEEFKNYQFGIFIEKINIYLKSLELILGIQEKKARWLLENIYFAEIKTSIRKDQSKPKFVYLNIDKTFAEVFSEFSEISNLLKNLSFMYEVYKDSKVYLSTEVLKRLLERKPLIHIAFKMLSEKITEKNSNVLPVWSIISLEYLTNQKRRLNMSTSKLYGILRGIQEAGRNSFSLEEIDKDKRFHISQRFLTLIRGARKEDFYNELLRLFVVYEKPIPETLFSLLTESDEITFQEKALAFLTGFISPESKENSKQNKEEGSYE